MPSQSPHDSAPSSAQSADQPALLRAVIESLMDGVLIVSAQGEIIQCNHRGRQLCNRLRRHANQTGSNSMPLPGYSPSDHLENSTVTAGDAKVSHLADWKILPPMLWSVCQTLLESQKEGAPELLVPEHQIVVAPGPTDQGLNLRIRAQWLSVVTDPLPSTHEAQTAETVSPSSIEYSYILVTLEDREQAIQHLATADQKRYHLTPRETEIWQMRLQGQSYRDIANQLFISQNTVKKHLKNILAKRREGLENAG